MLIWVISIRFVNNVTEVYLQFNKMHLFKSAIYYVFWWISLLLSNVHLYLWWFILISKKITGKRNGISIIDLVCLASFKWRWVIHRKSASFFFRQEESGWSSRVVVNVSNNYVLGMLTLPTFKYSWQWNKSSNLTSNPYSTVSNLRL